MNEEKAEIKRMNEEKAEIKTVHGICSECKEHCAGELEDGETYSECCGATVYNYEMGEA